HTRSKRDWSADVCSSDLLLLGAEDVDAPAAEARSPSRLDELAALLLERAAHVVPAARGVKVVDRRVGVRPMPADRHTIAGRLPRSEERRVGKECRRRGGG